VSTIKVDTVQSRGGGAVTLTDLYPPKAYVTYDGVVPEIDKSANVSSATDNGEGNHQFNLTSNFSDANYPIATTVSGHRLETSNQKFAIEFSSGEATSNFTILTRLCDNDAATFATSDVNRISAVAVS